MAKSETLIEALQNVIALSSMLEGLKPLKKEDEDRLWKKFRLEWNYNSNHIEGNTLTYIETELYLIREKTTGDHDRREYEEMSAHDAVVNLIREYAKDKSRGLTEADIREWNKTILVRPFWSDAQTPDGKPTRKLIQPGEYKREPNSVLLQNGEIFHYASPEETPAKMKELMEWYGKVTAEKKLHPVEIAAQLHYDFVRIHPFDDSNGRTSRLLMNFVLLQNGYPPVIIKSADKKGYLNALAKADVGDLEAFIEYIAKELIWSLNKSIDAAAGKNIADQDDIDKRISVWKKTLDLKPNKNSGKSIDTIIRVYGDSLIQLFEGFIKKHETLNEAFIQNDVYFYVDDTGNRLGDDVFLDLGRSIESLINSYKEEKRIVSVDFDIKWTVSCVHRILRKSSPNKFYVKSAINVSFLPLHYIISIDETEMISKPYSEILSDEEINQIINTAMSKVLDTVTNAR